MNAGAPEAASPGRGELKLRIVSALALAAIVLAVTWWGGWVFRLVWSLVAGIVAYEWMSITSRRNAMAAGIGVVLSGLLLGFLNTSQPALAGVAAFAALTGAVLTPFLRDRLALEGCGVAYALAFALVTPALRMLPEFGLAIIIWIFSVVALSFINGRVQCLWVTQPHV